MQRARKCLYPPNWDAIAKACKARADFRCQACRIRHGAIRQSKRTGKDYQVWLHAAHLRLHDTLNPHPALRCFCPSCHGAYDYQLRVREGCVRLERLKHRKALRRKEP